MFYHIITHTGCNLSSTYCDRDKFGAPDEETYDYAQPQKIAYDIARLKTIVTPEEYIVYCF